MHTVRFTPMKLIDVNFNGETLSTAMPSEIALAWYSDEARETHAHVPLTPGDALKYVLPKDFTAEGIKLSVRGVLSHSVSSAASQKEYDLSTKNRLWMSPEDVCEAAGIEPLPPSSIV